MQWSLVSIAAGLALMTSACGSDYGSIDALRDLVGCTDDGHRDADDTSETLSCTRGTDSFYLTVFENLDARDETLTYMRGLPKDGTTHAWMVYRDDWLIDCFDEAICEDLADESGGVLEQRK
ncbi:MAG: hypothetical protein CMH83_03865 [Nocardioides sp.]|nr:hypothetical protein [Nocardioides sp.]